MPKFKIAWIELASYETILEADNEDDAYEKLAGLDLNDASVEPARFNRFLDDCQTIGEPDMGLKG